MKYILSFLMAAVLSLTTAGQTWTAKQGVSMTGGTNGYYEYLPSTYNGTTKLPVIIFLHGLGEVGNGTSDLVKITNLGLPMFIKNQGFPYQAIVIAPQFNSAWPAWFVTEGVINYVRNNYAVDTNRIYLTGLSMGASTIFDWAAYGTTSKIAAIAPLCTSYGLFQPAGSNIKALNMPVYLFHGDQDAGYTDWQNSTSWLTYFNSAPSINPPAKMDTLEGYAHNIWNTVYDYSYIPPYNNGNNVYQWMLAQTKATAPPPNQAPTASAGANQTITLPTSSVTLFGSGSDPDGSVASYSWTKLSGTGGTITSPSSATTTVTGLSAGTYTFRLTVTDNLGVTGTSTTTVTVLSTPNQAPVANAGADQVITLPTSSVTLVLSGTDADGYIAGYSWSKVSGGNVSFSSTNSATVAASYLQPGTYVFRGTVTDNNGGFAYDDVQVIVNQPPTVTATSTPGSIQLPTSSVTLGSNASDADGTISSYSWARTAGTGGTITSPSSASTTVTGLTTGTYTFRVTVTDNRGGSTSAYVNVTVTGGNQTPVVNAGTDKSIKLPTTSVSLPGSATDPDGSISTLTWSKISGGAATIQTPNNAGTVVSGLSAGSYVFRLTAVDNSGGSAFDEVGVSVLRDTIYVSDVRKSWTSINGVARLTANVYFRDNTIQRYIVKAGTTSVFLKNVTKARETVNGVSRTYAILTYTDNTTLTIRYKILQ